MIQTISYVVLHSYFNEIIRGVILKGLGFSDLWFNGLLLLLMGVAILFFSSL
ncbi:MAG TPA: hypothetical protein VLH59_16380 [Ignavibacteriaceae bacterium]|nr:hypothetical protein [Ignavibacteriaceae bacterium]